MELPPRRLRHIRPYALLYSCNPLQLWGQSLDNVSEPPNTHNSPNPPFSPTVYKYKKLTLKHVCTKLVKSQCTFGSKLAPAQQK
jgi:hypothetical protein